MAEKGKFVNTKFVKPSVSGKLLCVTPINKQVVQNKKFVPKTEEKHVLTNTVTLQTSPTKKKDVDKNTNIIAPGMYKFNTANIEEVRLGHNLFSVGQFCDDDLEVAFRSKTCYVRNLEGDDLLTGAHESNLYTISISDMAVSSRIFLMSKKLTITNSWLEASKTLANPRTLVLEALTKQDLVDDFRSQIRQRSAMFCMRSRIRGKKATLPPKVGSMYSFQSKWNIHLWIYVGHEGSENISTTCFTQNHSLIHTHYNNTPYELLRDRKPNVQYFHVFGSLFFPTNDHEDLGKMKPKPDIGIFIGYSETSRGFQIFNRRTRKIMETIHVKFDELTTMASEHNCLEPDTNRFNNDDSSDEFTSTSSNEDLDNFFSPMYEKTFERKILLTSESSSTPEDLSNMHEFNKVQPSTHTWTKAHLLEQVLGDPSKPVMTRSMLYTNVEMCMYALTVSTTEPKNIKEAMSDTAG
ncbi:integrase, catalytic region, zinc finger, CCHC-type containing protein [Tanacetum coccineum]